MLEQEDVERLREIFVTRRECDNTTELIKAQVSNSAVRLAVIESQLKIIMWLVAAVGGGVITMLIKLFFGA